MSTGSNVSKSKQGEVYASLKKNPLESEGVTKMYLQQQFKDADRTLVVTQPQTVVSGII